MKPKTRQLNNLKFVLDAIPKAEAIQGRRYVVFIFLYPAFNIGDYFFLLDILPP